MKSTSSYIALITAAAALSLILISGGASAIPMAVIDSATPSTTEPTFTGTVTITVDLLLIDAEVSEGDVVLGWFPCTDLMCDPPEYVNLTLVSENTWSITIGPFEETSATGDPYVKITFFVEVSAQATDGSEDPELQRSEPQNIYFSGSEPHDDDTPADDDDQGDDEESPIGIGALIAGVLIMSAIIIRLRPRD